MEQDHLPCSCDQEVFERVWRRVMPGTARLPLYPGRGRRRPSAIQPRGGSACRGTLLQPANRRPPGPWWEKSTTCPAWGRPRRCTAPSSSGSLTGSWRTGGPIRPYPAGPRETAGGCWPPSPPTNAATPSGFPPPIFISGVRYWPVDRVPNPSPAPFSRRLREHFMEEQRGGRLPDRGGGDCRSLPPRALSGAGGE